MELKKLLYSTYNFLEIIIFFFTFNISHLKYEDYKNVNVWFNFT